jgi:probable H4MPT-linked C1 transfer pathway protein
LADVLGFDIGGANTKAAFISARKGRLRHAKVAVEYFPFWEEPEKLASLLLALQKQLGAVDLDGLGITMTAELSDAYNTKREGVHQILAIAKATFPDTSIYVLNTDAKLEPLCAAEEKPLGVAAANWAATGWLVSQRVKSCVIVDVGSTSTSIIPVVKGRVIAQGKTDLDKLVCGELVYTGGLRTNAAAIVQSVPTRKGVATVSSELFALSADVHLILGNIAEKDYTCETADGRIKTIPAALARVARIVCADTEMLEEQEIVDIASYVYEKQLMQVVEGLTKVYSYAKKLVGGDLPIIVTGLGKDFIARRAAEKIGAQTIIDLATLMQKDAALATPAFGVALMLASEFEGEIIKWTPP